MAEPTVRVTRYEVTCLPPDLEDADVFTVTVKYQGCGRWAVTRNCAFLGADGEWSYGHQWEDGREPDTDEELAAHSRSYDEWLSSHRFDLDTALELAKKAAPLITVNGWTVEKVLADIATREAADA